MIKRFPLLFALWAGLLWTATPALAHNAPFSALALHIGASGMDADFQASTKDFVPDIPGATPQSLLDPAVLQAQQGKMAGALNSRLDVRADGKKIAAALRGVDPIPDRNDVLLHLHYAWSQPPTALHLHGQIFPYDPRHKTFVNIYQDEKLRRQGILDKDLLDLDYRLGSRQSIGAVIRQFIFEGTHHIFIGPDHILFIVGLLLLGGSLKQLLKIVTAFTIAHSITLALATLNIVNPPARIIEPTIALSIVFVGVHSLTSKGARDPRLLFAFCFGFIHGFGFANALREMALPRYALGWSLFSFNVGVEIGQMCIVLAVSPLLALLRRRSDLVARRVVLVGSLFVILAGTFWFVQRAFFPS